MGSINRTIMWACRCMQHLSIAKATLWCVCGLLLFLGVRFVTYKVQSLHCDDTESQKAVDNLCAQFRSGKVAGNVCSSLCNSKILRYKKCLNYNGGKQVFLMNCGKGLCESWKSVAVVMKSKSETATLDHLKIPTHPNGSYTSEGLVVVKRVFEQRYEEMQQADIIKSEGNFYSHLWFQDFEHFIKTSRQRAPDVLALTSIWSLIEQDEYLFTKLTQELPYIPKLYGTCGSYYVMEYAPHGDALATYWKTAPWEDRRKLGIQFLEIALTLERDYNEPVHVCDIKEENFGVGDDHNVKLLDLDTLFFDANMMKMMQQPKCTKHEDCDFFDCHGWCNTVSGECVAQRTNNNLQSICEDIFIDRAMNLYQGLLHHPPMKYATPLTEALQACAYPNDNYGEIVRNPASKETLEEIRRILYAATDDDL